MPVLPMVGCYIRATLAFNGLNSVIVPLKRFFSHSEKCYFWEQLKLLLCQLFNLCRSQKFPKYKNVFQVKIMCSCLNWDIFDRCWPFLFLQLVPVSKENHFWIFSNQFLIFFNCYLAAQRPTLGHCRGDSLNHPMLLTAFYIFDPKVTGSLVINISFCNSNWFYVNATIGLTWPQLIFQSTCFMAKDSMNWE